MRKNEYIVPAIGLMNSTLTASLAWGDVDKDKYSVNFF